MWLKLLVPICISLVTINSARIDNVSFKNVRVLGYNMFTLKFNKTITSSNNLKENLPNILVDSIELTNQIPILYRNSISDLEDLDELTIKSNNLNEIQPGAFKNLPQLRQLVIADNRLEEIKEGVFNNLPISTLVLSGNRIDKIADGAFDNMPELLTINLADNRITKWNKNWFVNTPLLVRVSMQNNQIDELPAFSFRNLEGEKKFGKLRLTVNLIFSYNKIRNIDGDAFKHLKTIDNLWLDHNEIDNFNQNWFDGIDIDTLRIDYNKLTCVAGDFDKIFKADLTSINGNPWDCNCFENIEIYSDKHKGRINLAYSKMTCAAARIEKKLRNLEELLKKNKEEAEIEPIK